MTTEIYRLMPHGEAEPRAMAILADGYGEALILAGVGGVYALYYLFGVEGLRAPHPTHLPDWVEGPKESAQDLRPPYLMARWLEENGYELFVNESK